MIEKKLTKGVVIIGLLQTIKVGISKLIPKRTTKVGEEE